MLEGDDRRRVPCRDILGVSRRMWAQSTIVALTQLPNSVLVKICRGLFAGTSRRGTVLHRLTMGFVASAPRTRKPAAAYPPMFQAAGRRLRHRQARDVGPVRETCNCV